LEGLIGIELPELDEGGRPANEPFYEHLGNSVGQIQLSARIDELDNHIIARTDVRLRRNEHPLAWLEARSHRIANNLESVSGVITKEALRPANPIENFTQTQLGHLNFCVSPAAAERST
jgi:hypothetical protein